MRSRSPSALIPVLLWSLAIIPPYTALRADTPPPPDLDAHVSRVMTTFEVPGMAVAIVKDGRVVTAKGYGVRRLGETSLVDQRTLFGIASNTKAFTATTLGLLVEQGKIEWDAPVTRYLPWFQMWDPYVTRELTVRDLLVHRSGLGLGAGDLLWWPPSTYNRQQIVRRLRFIPPARSFRSAYAYDNVLYLVAGELIESIGGQTWEDFVARQILEKVGMKQSNVLHSAAGQGPNSATPHALVEGRVRPIKPFESDNTNPAGGINSCAEDMAKWMIVQLNEGRLSDGSRLFSEATARELTTIVTPIRVTDPPSELAPAKSNFNGYALGFGVSDYRGKKVVRHTGGLPGYVSMVFMVPEIELGVCVLTNQESAEAFLATVFHVVDHYLQAPRFDWVEAFQKTQERERARTTAQEKQAASDRNASSRPSLPLERYAGTYTDAWYGDVEIRQEAGKLLIRFTATPSLVGDLEHWQYDTFLARWKDRELRADAFVTFSLTPEGRVEQVKMKAVSPATDFSYDFHDLLLRPKAVHE